MSSNTLTNSLTSNTLYIKRLPNYFIFDNKRYRYNPSTKSYVRVLSDYINYTNNIVHKKYENNTSIIVPLPQTCLFLLQNK